MEIVLEAGEIAEEEAPRPAKRPRPSDALRCPLPDLAKPQAERLDLLAGDVLCLTPGTPQGCAAAAQYLRVLDGLASTPEQRSKRRAPASEQLIPALLRTCGVEGIGASAALRSSAGGSPSRQLLRELVPIALRCDWLWSSDEKRALEAVASTNAAALAASAADRAPAIDAATAEQMRSAELLLPTLPPEYRGDGGRSGSAGSSSQPPPDASAAVAGSGGPTPRSDGRLELVLDLDHTLVHAIEQSRDSRRPPGVHCFPLKSRNGRADSRYMLHVREGVRAFLREARSFCTLHVYTMGSHSYTRQVLDLIDPAKGIDGQVHCRKDGEEQPFEKSLMHIERASGPEAVRRRDRMIILDDREDAWCVRSRPHVLPIPQFRAWFDDGTPVASRPEPDVTLWDMLNVLRGVSEDIASGTVESVPAALQRRRRSVLSGCVLVFSGGIIRDRNQLKLSAPWRMAETLGARCEDTYDKRVVTHVVSNQEHTNSVKKAKEDGLHAITIQWLVDTFVRWRRQDETLYAHGHAAGSRGTSGAGPGAALTMSSEQRVERACEIVRRLLVPEASYTGSQRLSVAIRLLAPPDKKAVARQQIERFEGSKELDAAAAQDALDRITKLLGKEALQVLVQTLAIPSGPHQ